MPIVGLVIALMAFTAFNALNMDAQVKLKKQESYKRQKLWAR